MAFGRGERISRRRVQDDVPALATAVAGAVAQALHEDLASRRAASLAMVRWVLPSSLPVSRRKQASPTGAPQVGQGVSRLVSFTRGSRGERG